MHLVPMISSQEIQRKVADMARRISGDFGGKEPIMVGVLKGAFIFMADLCRFVDIPVKVDFMAVSSYGAATESSGVVKILKDLDEPIEGKNVILVEDIIDTGLTLKYLEDLLLARRPASLDVCALVDKPSRRMVKLPVEPRYVGFEIPDVFVVGYGLDCGGLYRNVPELCRLGC